MIEPTENNDRIDYDEAGDLDDVAVSDISLFRMERIDDNQLWLRCYRTGRPDIVIWLSSSAKIVGKSELDDDTITDSRSAD